MAAGRRGGVEVEGGPYDVDIRRHPGTAARASARRGCRASRGMESTLFVAVSCLLLNLGDQSRIRKAVSVVVYPPALYLRIYVCGPC